MTLTPYYERPGYTAWLGDSAAILPMLPSGSCDALVTDPPAGIGFMGREWDKDRGGRDQWIAWLSGILAECRRVLKPGAHALVWALPRTSHWTATAIEDAGFEVRDVIVSLFGSGFPKSLNLGDGSGTALKPASEHWILARAPLIGTTTATHRKHGTAGLNIDDCRIGTSKRVPGGISQSKNNGVVYGGGWGIETGNEPGHNPNVGRWPANVVLSHHMLCEDGACVDGCVVAEVDRQSGTSGSATPGRINRGASSGYMNGWGDPLNIERPAYTDIGGASRFLYVAKPSRAERESYLDALPVATRAERTGRKEGSAGLSSPRAGAGRTSSARNIHPTVKPLNLMRWLVRLVTPAGGVVLDPFLGSGTTAVAARMEARGVIGIEQDRAHVEIAVRRVAREAMDLDSISLPQAQERTA